MKHRLALAGGAVVAAGIIAGILNAGDSTEEKPASSARPATVMDRKLEHSQELLTSLAKEDFKSLEHHARELGKIARQQWQKNPTPAYQAHLKTFWITLEGIEAGAQRKDVEDAAMAYMQMTLSCVKCHKTIRRELRLK